MRQSDGLQRYARVVLSVEASSGPEPSFTWDVSPEQIPDIFKDAVYLGVRQSFEADAQFDGYSPEGLKRPL